VKRLVFLAGESQVVVQLGMLRLGRMGANIVRRLARGGEDRRTAIAAIDEGVPALVLAAPLFSRVGSGHLDLFADKVLSTMRKQIGGHAERPVS
jgi:6-phosphogluconate dehydrogenase (decarboxylating)